MNLLPSIDTLFHFENHQDPPLQVTGTQEEMQQVVKNEHSIEVPKKPSKYECGDCNKAFKSNGHLKRHVVIHSDEKVFQCQDCTKSFNQYDNLKTHVNTVHSDRKNFKCNVCQKSFSLKGSLKTHKKTHDIENAPFKCEIETCDKKFVQKSLYEAHKRVHTGEKPFKCSMCQSSFARQSTLHNHVKYKNH